MTVAQMKAWLQNKGVSVTGKKKGELVDAVEEYFEKK